MVHGDGGSVVSTKVILMTILNTVVHSINNITHPPG